MKPKRIFLLAFIAVLAFASNSLLCRLALAQHSIDAWSFTGIRLASAALVLGLIFRFRSYRQHGSSKAALSLAVYALFFSLAYVQLNAATGALLLFGTVQISLWFLSVMKGERLSKRQKWGYSFAVLGLFYLLLPGVESPKALPAVFMILSGLGWAFYTYFGKSSQDALQDTYSNFMRLWPVSLLLLAFAFASGEHAITSQGVVWAILSGALASGLGYAVWYHILPSMPSWQAGLFQLTVPPLASLAAVIFLGETLSVRWYGASLLVLCGLGLCLKWDLKPRRL